MVKLEWNSHMGRVKLRTGAVVGLFASRTCLLHVRCFSFRVGGGSRDACEFGMKCVAFGVVRALVPGVDILRMAFGVRAAVGRTGGLRSPLRAVSLMYRKAAAMQVTAGLTPKASLK